MLTQLIEQTKTIINFHLPNSIGWLIFNTTWSLGCLMDVILHVSSSTQHDWVILIIEISDSDTIIKNGFLKAEIKRIIINNYNYLLEHSYKTIKL